MNDTTPPPNECDGCGNDTTLWIECDDCHGYDQHPHHFSACDKCYLTSQPFVEKGQPR